MVPNFLFLSCIIFISFLEGCCFLYMNQFGISPGDFFFMVYGAQFGPDYIFMW